MKLRLLQKTFWLLLVFCFSVSHAQTTLQPRLNPTNWWVGMKHNQVQVLAYAPNIAKNAIQLKPYSGVKLLKVHRVENPNYVFIDLLISPQTRPGNITFLAGKSTFNFPLLRRSGYQTEGLTPNDIIYLLMPDRFANGDESNDKFADMADKDMDRNNPWLRHGGDLQGVEQNLNYFKYLGVTTLWLNPVIENDQFQTDEGGTMRSAYHGYGFTDHYNVDRRLGGNAAYESLVEAAHAKGLKVVQDAVYNHIGINHWILRDMPFKEWLNQWPTFTQTSFREQPVLDPNRAAIDDKIMTDGWFMPFLPDLNQKNPFVANFLIQHAIWTVEKFKIDGWRIDTYMYNDMPFMNRCNSALLKEYPKITLFGESLASPVANQAAFVKNNIKGLPFNVNLPSTLDYQLHKAINDALTQNYGWSDGINRLYNTLGQDFLYQQPHQLITYLDNHDEHRFLSIVGEDQKKFRMGLAWLLTLRGIPQLYYGTEILMKNFKNPTDAEVRKDFPGGWKDDKVNKFLAAGRTEAENENFQFIRQLNLLRQGSEAIGKGKLTQFLPLNEGLYVYFRHSPNQKIMVVSNTSKKAQTLDLKRYEEMLQGKTQGTDMLTKQPVNLSTLEIGVSEFRIIEIN